MRPNADSYKSNKFEMSRVFRTKNSRKRRIKLRGRGTIRWNREFIPKSDQYNVFIQYSMTY